MASATITTGSADCTVDRFRERARETFQPWHQRKTGEWRLRRLKRCAPNERTLGGMKQIHGSLARGRAEVIQLYRSYTPYDCGSAGRYAIECYIVSAESGYNCRARNGVSTAGGCYQIIDSTWYRYGGRAYADSHPAAVAPTLEQHKIAQRIWAGGSGCSQWVTC